MTDDYKQVRQKKSSSVVKVYSVCPHLVEIIKCNFRAIDENLEEVACFLIRSGCDLNACRRPGLNGEGGEEAYDGLGPLHLAAQWGQENVVTCLIEHNADINRYELLNTYWLEQSWIFKSF